MSQTQSIDKSSEDLSRHSMTLMPTRHSLDRRTVIVQKMPTGMKPDLVDTTTKMLVQNFFVVHMAWCE